MQKIKSENDLQDAIDKEHSWRLKEIHDLKSLVKTKKNQNSIETNVFSKSLVLISYSHWEGFVKNAARYYLSYIQFISLNKSQLSNRLVASFVFQLTLSNKNRSEKIASIMEGIADPSYKFSINIDELVDAESNLTSGILEKILSNIGIQTNAFKTKSQYIDSVILKFRNDYAHGGFEYINADQAIEISEKVLELMSLFKTEIENSLCLKKYHI